MKRLLLPACALLLATTSQAAQFQFPVGTVTVPDGFTVELVAAPPLVDRPMMACFDDRGRLFVADSSGSNEPVQQQLEKKPHRIVRLEDTNGDGIFDRSIVFADRLMFPEGVLWHDGAVYTGAPPTIWKLEDTDDDGVADRRAEWFQGKTLTGCANDLHGPYLGPDGWIYWCKGAFAKQTHERPGRPTISDGAAHIFRCRPDGSEFDSVMAGGMDNPVEVAWSPAGELFFITTFFHHPEAGKRDAIVHCIYGGAYPKPHSALDGVPRTGDLLPALVELGPAAACALTWYESTAWGPDYTGNLFSTEFNLRKVGRHILTPHGATFRSQNEDFLVADNPDFHPTDVFEDADGSLLVIDTGGWYKICCPTSQLPKPDVLGAIYRIRRSSATPAHDPRGLQLPWPNLNPASLATLLDDPRPAVRQRAIAELARRQATPALRAALDSPSPSRRRNAVWTLTRLNHPEARAAVRHALGDPDPSVRQAALHAVAMHRDPEAFNLLLPFLHSDSPFETRKAAEALGRLGQPAAVPLLLHTAGQFRARFGPNLDPASERILEHALIYALLELAHPDALTPALASTNAFLQRAALMALDQMTGSPLEPGQTIPFLTSPDPILRHTANWIVAHRPAWGGALASFYQDQLLGPRLTPSESAELASQLAVLARDVAIQTLLHEALTSAQTPVLAQTTALAAMARAGLKEPPTPWIQALTSALRSTQPAVLTQAVATARALNLPKQTAPALAAALLRTANSPQHPDLLRLEALAALPGGLPDVPAPLATFLFAQLAPTHAVPHRSLAATIVAKAKLSPEQTSALADTLPTVSPLELTKLLAAFEGATNEALGLKLIDALQASPAVSSLTPDLLRRTIAGFPDSVQQRSLAVQQLLAIDVPAMNARLESLLTQLDGGDVRRGQLVFNSPKAACATCHAMGYVGGRLGPDLTSIGQIRTERDLLEAILYPSASFVRSYEPMTVVTTDGDDFSGVLRKDAADEVILATGPDTEERIPRERIAEMHPGSVSTMPGGLEEQLTRQELVDLIAFLKNTRWGAQ